MKQNNRKHMAQHNSSRREMWINLLIPSQEMPGGSTYEIDKTYQGYMKDAKVSKKVSDLIEKDIRRTKISPIQGLSGNYLEEKVDGEKVGKIVARILTVFASTNRSVGYVQGMNVICAILYYVISYDVPPHSESVAYFCFFYLMVDIGDYFAEKMDDAETGLQGEQATVMKILKQKDKKLYKKIEEKGLFRKSAFHIRWMILLFSAEFVLRDTLVIWDRFFRETPKRKMVPYLCASVLIILKDKIMVQDEIKTISSLEIAKVNPYEALNIAERLFKNVPYCTLKTDPAYYLSRHSGSKKEKA